MADEITEGSFKHYGEWSPEEQYIRLYCPQEMRVPIGRVYDENRTLTTERDALAAQNAVLREALVPCVQRPFRDPRCSDVEVLISEDDFARAIEALADPAPRAEALLAVVEALRGMLEFTAGMEEYYGPFPGGDPRRFTPDIVNCSAKELQAWEAACAEWDAGEGDDRGPSCLTFGDGSSRSGTGFGVGAYRYDVPEIQNARAALARLDGKGE